MTETLVPGTVRLDQLETIWCEGRNAILDRMVRPQVEAAADLQSASIS